MGPLFDTSRVLHRISILLWIDVASTRFTKISLVNFGELVKRKTGIGQPITSANKHLCRTCSNGCTIFVGLNCLTYKSSPQSAQLPIHEAFLCRKRTSVKSVLRCRLFLARRVPLCICVCVAPISGGETRYCKHTQRASCCQRI